jgi:hypothetical protein
MRFPHVEAVAPGTTWRELVVAITGTSTESAALVGRNYRWNIVRITLYSNGLTITKTTSYTRRFQSIRGGTTRGASLVKLGQAHKSINYRPEPLTGIIIGCRASDEAVARSPSE